MPVVALYDHLELGHELGALAVVLDEDPAILEVVNLQFPGDRCRVHTPRRDVRQVRPRRRRVGVVVGVGHRRGLDVRVALARVEDAGLGRGRAVAEVGHRDGQE